MTAVPPLVLEKKIQVGIQLQTRKSPALSGVVVEALDGLSWKVLMDGTNDERSFRSTQL
jgi:hypothetical protein